MSSATFTQRCAQARLSADDGRVQFPRYRHEQLANLYNALSANRQAIADAVQLDSGRTVTEANVELGLAMQHVKKQSKLTDYALLSAKEALDVKRGVIARGKGLIVLAADEKAPLLSLIAPLALGIAAGNAVVSILADGTPTLSALLEKELSLSLDPLAFVFASPSDTSTTTLISSILDLDPELVVTSNLAPDITASISTRQTAHYSPPALQASASTSVIVDQSAGAAQLQHIAALIVRGKFFGLGRLAGSVDHVFAHRNIAGDLLELVLSETARAYGVDGGSLSQDYGRLVGGAKGEKGVGGDKEVERLKMMVKREIQNGTGKVVAGGSAPALGVFAPTIIENASLNMLSTPIRGPILPFLTVGSLEAALAMQAKVGSKVLYIFASPEKVRYVADESGAEMSYDNDIPLEALIQPQAAIPPSESSLTAAAFAHRPADLYDPALFTVTRQIFSVSPSPAHLFAPFTSAKLALLAKTYFPSNPARLTTTRPKHSVPILRAFFPQGLFLVGGSVLIVLLSSLGWGVLKGLGWARARYF